MRKFQSDRTLKLACEVGSAHVKASHYGDVTATNMTHGYKYDIYAGLKSFVFVLEALYIVIISVCSKIMITTWPPPIVCACEEFKIPCGIAKNHNPTLECLKCIIVRNLTPVTQEC